MLKKINYIFEKQEKKKLVLLFVTIFIGGFMELLGTSLIMPLVTVIMNPEILETNQWAKTICTLLRIKTSASFLLFMLVLLIFVYIIKNIYLIMMYNFQYQFTFDNQRKLALKLMNCYMNQDYSFHLSKNSAELQRNVTTDVSHFFSTVLNCIQLVSELITCIFLAIYLMTTDIMTVLGALIIIGTLVLAFNIGFRKTLVGIGQKYRQEHVQMIKWIQQSFGGIKEIKILNRENYFLSFYDQCCKKNFAMLRKQKIMGDIPKPILESVCICGVLVVMAIRVRLGANLLQFVPALSAFAVATFRMLPAFSRITSYISAIAFNRTSVNAVYEDLKEAEKLSKYKKEAEKDTTEIRLKTSISMKDVSFKYPNTENYVLNHINLEIPAYQSIAFIGPSGAGKTTLADVLLGVFMPETGSVCVDNIDIFEHLYSWHKVIGYIPQTIYLIDDTIRNNVTFGLPECEIDDLAVWRALKEAQLEDFVKALDKGLDTVIGERGVRLSGGQRQRVGIARALYNDPQILVLDEATSALDTDTETALMDAIEQLQGNKTMIIIAHRLTTIKNCDLIYEVNNGKVLLRDKTEVLKKI